MSQRTTWTLVEVATSQGRIGLGEASLHYGQDEILAHLRRYTNALLDRAARATSLDRSLPTPVDLTQAVALSALDEALFDLDGQRLGCPTAALLSEAPRADVAVYANINRRTSDRTPGGFAASAAAAATAGFSAIKIAPFDRVRPQMSSAEAAPWLSVAFQRIAAVREAIGPDRLLMVDCHWRLNASMAEEVVAAGAQNSLFWIESPFAEEPEWFDAIRAFRKRANALGIRIAGGEFQVQLAGFGPIIGAELYDVLMPDMTFVGGYEAFMQVAQAAAARGIDVSPHNPIGPVCHAHTVQVSAALPQLLHMEMQFAESPMFTQIVSGALPMPTKGRIVVPREAGLGLRYLPQAGEPSHASDSRAAQ